MYGGDHNIRFWDLETRQRKDVLNGHTGVVKCLQVIEDQGVVSASLDGSLRMWEVS